jgi:protein ImuA
VNIMSLESHVRCIAIPPPAPRRPARRSAGHRGGGAGEKAAPLSFGIEAVDRHLAGGGLAVSALHEMTGRRRGWPTMPPPPCSRRGSRRDCKGRCCGRWPAAICSPPAWRWRGCRRGRLLFAECGRDEDVLAVMEEGLRHGGLAAVVGEVGRAAMASTRRLQLAAEEGGVTALMLKRWRRNGEDPLGLPSSAMTRWRIACAPSSPLPVAGIGRRAGASSWSANAGASLLPGFWRDRMPRVASLYLPYLPHRSAAADRGAKGRRAA